MTMTTDEILAYLAQMVGPDWDTAPADRGPVSAASEEIVRLTEELKKAELDATYWRGEYDDAEKRYEDYSGRIAVAICLARRFGQIDGAHHKTWVIDQVIRVLTNCPLESLRVGEKGQPGFYEYQKQGESDEYKKFIAEYCDGEDGPNTYEWDVGVAP